MSDEHKAPAPAPAQTTPAPNPQPQAEAKPDALAPQEVSLLRSLARILGFGGAGPAQPAGAPAPAQAPAQAQAQAPAQPQATAEAPAAPVATPLTKEQADVLIRALRDVGTVLQPRTPAPSKPNWPRTQMEVMQWSMGSPEQRAAVQQAIEDGLLIKELPKR